MKRGQCGSGGGLNALGKSLLGGEITSPQHSEPVDQHCLFERRAADQPAIIELRTGKSAVFIIFQTPEEGIGIPVSLNGFAQGIEALP